MKKISNVFWLLAVLLTNVMCAVVAYEFCNMQWLIKYAGYSAPADITFLYAIPYLFGSCVCVVVALSLRKRGK